MFTVNHKEKAYVREREKKKSSEDHRGQKQNDYKTQDNNKAKSRLFLNWHACVSGHHHGTTVSFSLSLSKGIQAVLG